jgi:alkylhydroperoxidase family enzyme
VLLRGPSSLARGERELIAAYVSALNDCQYCWSSHSACAAAQLPEGMALVREGYLPPPADAGREG